ncbi:hypothetical protein BBK36DRAFT_1113928 [Trichoderma citrinoviride]|uniref:DUF2293 domain-containing protein n=1 Tax=Trichoderma citrinoviride TaxID=58853 RepID=A0A2T4BIN8_9HYPO|nr:hypothetical protein BBK36DRAFT_1113928 [Trichoderma citrinoviride]PTB69173.1 hypothetical protein BBK36DRAFT_1113928 [Trichoderma citrinoviride]
MNRESTISPDTPMPKGYGFLKKGNPFMTALCRRKTHEARKTLYIVSSRGKQQGLRAPKWIIHQVFSEEKASRERRRGAVERRDAATQDAFAAAILKSFPKIPKQDLTTILKRTLRKRSGRVGRTGTLDSDKKAHLAVQAHVRHCHTDYDKLTKETRDREAARRAIRDKVSKLLVEWGGKPAAVKPGGNRDVGSSDEMRESRKSRAPRKAMARTTQRLVARRSSVSKVKEPPRQIRPSRRHHPRPQPQPQPLPVVIDLTQDDDGDGSEETASASRASSEDEYQDSSGQEGGDGSYELSDAMDSDGDYEVDSDWLSG